MNFQVLPPEINSALIYSGAGSAPMLEAAVAWDGLAAGLGSAAASFSSLISGLVGGPGQTWQGAAADAMVVAAAPYSGYLSAAAARTAEAAASAKAMANVFETARTAMVDPLLVAANRSQLARLVVSNWFGQNTPAIAAAEAAV